MAKIGLRYVVYNNEDGKNGIAGKAIQADISIQANDVKLYADDALAESDKSFQSGAITLGIDDLSDTVQADFLGHDVTEEGEIVANKDDEPKETGIGFFGVKMVNNVKKFRAIWLHKVKFSEPNDDNQTKGENPAFSTPVLTGEIMVDDNGDWKSEQTFDTTQEAISYLNEKANYTPEP